MNIIICGGGAIGSAIAYYCARRGATPLVIERHDVAGAASGKSGGFLALDWCRGTPLDRLARRSFALHAELAEELENPWDYHRLNTFAGLAPEAPAGRNAAELDWLSPMVRIDGRIGTRQTTAAVEPRAFTQGLLEAARALGAGLVIGTVSGLARSANGTVHGVRLENGETIEGDAVVIALGPWSMLACRWLDLPAIHGFKGHSLVFATGEQTPQEALFLEYREANGETLTPEIFPRGIGTGQGTVWACAVSSTPALPLDPAQVSGDRGAHERLEALCRAISPVLAAAPIVARQACFRPVSEDGLPLIGAVPGAPGAYVATGHSVWGMLNAPATGEAMAELILDGAAQSVSLSPFAPGRLRAFGS